MENKRFLQLFVRKEVYPQFFGRSQRNKGLKECNFLLKKQQNKVNSMTLFNPSYVDDVG